MHVGLVLSPCDRLHIDTPGYVAQEPDFVLQRQIFDLHSSVKRQTIVEWVRLHFYHPPTWEYPISVSCRVGD